MTSFTRQTRTQSEANIQAAIRVYSIGEFTSIRAAARAFSVPYPILRHRMSGRNSRSTARESQQSLSYAEERTLVRYITRLTRTGFPASPALVVEIAEEIRRSRVVSKTPAPPLRPLGKNWSQRFRERHEEIASIWTRQIDSARHNGVNRDVVTRWFAAVTELFIENEYSPDRIFNVDESGFAVGASQSSRVLVNIRENTSWKVINGRQEWITAIECVNAAGAAIPPLLIFKAKYTNTAWIPANTPPNWRFSTSTSGWTSNSHAYEWLTAHFEPYTRPTDPNLRRLLILDGHGSHITASFIAGCINYNIDLLVLPPHTSHILQPLDISLFAPLKRALAIETDTTSRIDSGRISRVEWTESYIRAREKAFISTNILSGWRATGLYPLSPITILETLPALEVSTLFTPTTPTISSTLDYSLLNSSPPDGTELRTANTLYNSAIASANNIPSPVKRYGVRATRALETIQSENAILRRQLSEQQKLLNTRKKRTKGKRVALEGRFVFSTEEILDIARKAEAETAKRQAKKPRREREIDPEILGEQEDVFESAESEFDDDCVIITHRT